MTKASRSIAAKPWTFLHSLLRHLGPVKRCLRTGVSAALTVPGRLPTAYKDRVALAKRLASQILLGGSAQFDDGSSIRIADFDVVRLGDIPSNADAEVRAAIDDVTGTRNREAMVIGTPRGGALAVTLQSAADDSLMAAVFGTLSDSAKRQLTGRRAAIFLVGFDGLDGDQILSIASQDRDPAQPPTSLRLAVSKFLSGNGREQVVGVGFLSRSALMPVKDGVVDTGGSAYCFPRFSQCNFTCGSVRRVIIRASVSSATFAGPCSAYSCILYSDRYIIRAK